MKGVAGIVALALACACSNPPSGVVLWHAYTGSERAALEATATTWNAHHPGTPLTLVAVPYDGFGDKLTSAIPGGNGPDLFIYPQDRIGDWADAGVIEPIEFWVDDARADRYTEQALSAMAYHGSLWGLPIALKSLALYYRTDLVDHPPTTTDDILALAPKMKAKDGYALAYTNADLYGHAPWLHAFGGKVMDDHGTLVIATPEAAAAMAFARMLVADGISPPDAQSPQVATLFNEGKAATVMSGPWFMTTDIAPGVPWAVTTLPIVSPTGTPAMPFVGAEGILMSSRAHDTDAAFAVMDELTGDAAAIQRARLARQLVANKAAYADPEVARDTALRVFRAQLAHSVSMSNRPEMRPVWTPYQDALRDVLAGRAEPGERLLKVEHDIAGFAAGAH